VSAGTRLANQRFGSVPTDPVTRRFWLSTLDPRLSTLAVRPLDTEVQQQLRVGLLIGRQFFEE